MGAVTPDPGAADEGAQNRLTKNIIRLTINDHKSGFDKVS